MSIITKTLAIAALLLVLPALSDAATFAYVNQNNEVTSMQAATALQALATAPNIHPRSGVLLLSN